MKLNRSIRRAFKDRVAVVTGAGSGIGLGMTRHLFASGARIHAVDFDPEAPARMEHEFGRERVTVHTLDVSDATAFGQMVAKVIELDGCIDFLFNNAGVTLLAEAHRAPFKRWKWLLDINVMGVVHGVAHVYPLMVERGSGHIVNTASIAGITGYPTAAAYTMSKACVLELSRSLREEARDFGVKVSVACPGYVRTGIFTQDRTVGADLEEVIKDLPAGMMDPSDAAVRILHGTARGRETIVFPFSARLLWKIACWFPVLLAPIHARLLRKFH